MNFYWGGVFFLILMKKHVTNHRLLHLVTFHSSHFPFWMVKYIILLNFWIKCHVYTEVAYFSVYELAPLHTQMNHQMLNNHKMMRNRKNEHFKFCFVLFCFFVFWYLSVLAIIAKTTEWNRPLNYLPQCQ